MISQFNLFVGGFGIAVMAGMWFFYTFKKRGFITRQKTIFLKDVFYLDTKNKLIVCRWKDKDYLLTQSPQGLHVVDQHDAVD